MKPAHKISRRPRRAAHFLLLPELLDSPPNKAIIQTLLDQGYEVHIFSPGTLPEETSYGCAVRTHKVDYHLRWLFRHIANYFWFSFTCFSGTSEDPLAVVGVLSALTRRPSFLLLDEIRAGSYRGNTSERWKSLCRWAIRKARFTIVNDASRVSLLRDYASLRSDAKVIVYPGCFSSPPKPEPAIRQSLRSKWEIPSSALLIAASGRFELDVGGDWLIQALLVDQTLHAVVQPLGIPPLSRFLLAHLGLKKRLYLQEERLSWDEAWRSAVAFDIGLAIYTNPAPQFQRMGISSNRLCMFIAMGVPVICSDQESFKFIETYDCGCLVNSYDEFIAATKHIRSNLRSMRANCKTCFNDYIMPPGRLESLKLAIASLSQNSYPRPR